MSLDHEYALLGGFNRTHVGRWLSILAASISSGLVFVLLTAIDLAKRLGVDAKLPPMALSLVGAGMVYAVLYLAFNHVVWRLGLVRRLLKVPDISGTWRCVGMRREVSPPVAWEGSLIIVQSWDRLRVHLQTGTSASDSIAAALQYDTVAGFRLMYHYANQPRLEAGGLAAHHGFAELTFAPDGRGAIGEYFNGRGRNTYGTMALTREGR